MKEKNQSRQTTNYKVLASNKVAIGANIAMTDQ